MSSKAITTVEELLSTLIRLGVIATPGPARQGESLQSVFQKELNPQAHYVDNSKTRNEIPPEEQTTPVSTNLEIPSRGRHAPTPFPSTPESRRAAASNCIKEFLCEVSKIADDSTVKTGIEQGRPSPSIGDVIPQDPVSLQLGGAASTPGVQDQAPCLPQLKANPALFICSNCGEVNVRKARDYWYVVQKGLKVGIVRHGHENHALTNGVRKNYSRRHQSFEDALEEWRAIVKNGTWVVIPPVIGQEIPNVDPIVHLDSELSAPVQPASQPIPSTSTIISSISKIDGSGVVLDENRGEEVVGKGKGRA